MPNHVTNKIKFYGEQENINKILETIKNDDCYIDFNKIIPTPDYIYQGNIGPEERLKYGPNNWYNWNCSNWGTKWNAYSDSLDKNTNTILFNTAWSAPIPIFEALANLCYKHNVWFEGCWADEDCGYNVGKFESHYDGDTCWFENEYIENCSNEAYEIYVDLNGESMCLGKNANGSWISYSCDDCPNASRC